MCNNIIVGCIYKHPDNNIDDLNTNCLRPLLQKLSKELPKHAFLLGNFNIDIVKFNSCRSISNFLDELSSSYIIPQICLPSHITGSKKTLSDIIFLQYPTIFWTKYLSKLNSNLFSSATTSTSCCNLKDASYT